MIQNETTKDEELTCLFLIYNSTNIIRTVFCNRAGCLIESEEYSAIDLAVWYHLYFTWLRSQWTANFQQKDSLNQRTLVPHREFRRARQNRNYQYRLRWADRVLLLLSNTLSLLRLRWLVLLRWISIVKLGRIRWLPHSSLVPGMCYPIPTIKSEYSKWFRKTTSTCSSKALHGWQFNSVWVLLWIRLELKLYNSKIYLPIDLLL